jgi:hypothetical protein
MIVMRIQLHCNCGDCKNHFPEDGALDGAIYRPADLRAQAYNHGGWHREKTGFGLMDVCPSCYAARRAAKRKGAR